MFRARRHNPGATAMMPKSDTLSAIMELNPTARPTFLAEFSNEDLLRYLDRLTALPVSSVDRADRPIASPFATYKPHRIAG